MIDSAAKAEIDRYFANAERGVPAEPKPAEISFKELLRRPQPVGAPPKDASEDRKQALRDVLASALGAAAGSPASAPSAPRPAPAAAPQPAPAPAAPEPRPAPKGPSDDELRDILDIRE